MATIAQGVAASSPSSWLAEFLRDELSPYEGRMATVGRTVLAATLVMLICETFRIPFAFESVVFTLLISRESPQATVQSAATIFLVTGLGTAWLLICAWFSISIPWLHLLCNLASFFLAFYVIAALTNYSAAVVFGIIIAIGIPIWDNFVSADTNVQSTLWILVVALTGVSVPVVVELAFAHAQPGNEIVLPIAHRLAAVRDILVSSENGDSGPDRAAKKNILRFRTLGTSRLRHLLLRSAYSDQYRARMQGVVGLSGRLVDVAATLMDIPWHTSQEVETRARNLAVAVERISDDLTHERIPEPVHFERDADTSAAASLLGEMEYAVELIPQAFAGSGEIDEYHRNVDDVPPPKLFALDALSNPGYYQFAFKGCLAAGGAYIIYHAIDWALNTSITTCVVTALSTIGASRQKQYLRFLGVLIGGALSLGAQIFFLPYVDSITGFVLLFVPVAFLSAWIMTSSPRLSYLGLMVAFGFYIVHLQEFAPQLSLSIARDRLAGVLLGLFMMWLVFDHLWAAPAALEMKATFIASIRLLARLTREPSSGDIPEAIKRSHILGEMLMREWDTVRSQGDAVLFEFGPSRQSALALRESIRRWQVQLRILFLLRRASLRYSLGLSGFELPQAARTALREYNEISARVLDEMADRLEGRSDEPTPETEIDERSLEQVVAGCCGPESREMPEPIRSFVILLRRIDGVTRTLAEEVRTSGT